LPKRTSTNGACESNTPITASEKNTKWQKAVKKGVRSPQSVCEWVRQRVDIGPNKVPKTRAMESSQNVIHLDKKVVVTRDLKPNSHKTVKKLLVKNRELLVFYWWKRLECLYSSF
jgi:hypothetical protein